MASLTLTNVLLLLVVYLVGLAIYRLYLSPLAKIPGPKIAALTSWYCAYHDICKAGTYVWVIQEMHRQYGPIVRIMPNVIHVNDPNFIDKLYTSSPSSRRERSWTVLNMTTTFESTLFTRDHHLHRRRRNALSRFFSQGNVRRLVPVINETASDLMHRLAGWAKEDRPISLHDAYRAATKDVIQGYCLGDGRKCLQMEDLNVSLFSALQPREMCHVGVHVHWFFRGITYIPLPIMVKLVPPIAAFVKFWQDLTAQIEHIRSTRDHPEGSTVFHEVLRSDLPESEKSTARLADEAQILVFAGADTTAMTLAALTYRVLSDRNIFKRLRKELESIMPDATQPPDPVKLADTVYLNALIEEAVRFYPSAAHRQMRTAPDESLVYQYPDSNRTIVIPAGTPIGMTAQLINRSTLWHDDPDTFNPDRFIKNPKFYRRNLTFSKGLRQCIGMSLAYQELQTFVATVFRTYSPYDPNLKQQNGPTIELFETTERDVGLFSDFITMYPYPGSLGLRVKVRDG